MKNRYRVRHTITIQASLEYDAEDYDEAVEIGHDSIDRAYGDIYKAMKDTYKLVEESMEVDEIGQKIEQARKDEPHSAEN